MTPTEQSSSRRERFAETRRMLAELEVTFNAAVSPDRKLWRDRFTAKTSFKAFFCSGGSLVTQRTVTISASDKSPEKTKLKMLTKLQSWVEANRSGSLKRFGVSAPVVIWKELGS